MIQRNEDERSHSATVGERLIIKRFVPADVAAVFDAWTRPEKLKKWWGPANVQCVAAEIDLRVGGRYLISNKLPDQTVLNIVGEYEVVEKPHRLIYTWRLDVAGSSAERVEVRFDADGDGTTIKITHERIPTTELKEQHQSGWFGCLDGLAEYLA